MAGAAGEGRPCRTGRSAQGKTERAAHCAGDRRGGARAIPGKVLRPEPPALPPEAAGGARDRVELRMGTESVRGRRLGGQATRARAASTEAAATAAAWDAVAH